MSLFNIKYHDFYIYKIITTCIINKLHYLSYDLYTGKGQQILYSRSVRPHSTVPAF